MDKLELNRVLASFCRQKILMELSKQKELTVMELVRKVNSTYDEVNRNLHILDDEDLVTQKYVGRMRFISLNLKNENTSVLLRALKTLEHENPLQPSQDTEVIEYGKQPEAIKQQLNLLFSLL